MQNMQAVLEIFLFDPRSCSSSICWPTMSQVVSAALPSPIRQIQRYEDMAALIAFFNTCRILTIFLALERGDSGLSNGCQIVEIQCILRKLRSCKISDPNSHNLPDSPVSPERSFLEARA